MVSATHSSEVSLTIPARAEYVGLVRLALSAVSRLTSLSGDEVADLKLAADEAARRWVPPTSFPDDGHSVEPTDEPPSSVAAERLGVRYGLDAGRLMLEVTCHGPEVMPVSERRLSLAILRATADECHAEPGRIRLVKYLRPEPTG